MKTCSIYGDLDDELGRLCEFQVQVMLRAGIEFLAQHPGYDLDADPAEINSAMKDARTVIGAGNGISGGQYEAVMTHLRKIQELSYQTWLEELRKDRAPEQSFEFDGTMLSIPRLPKLAKS